MDPIWEVVVELSGFRLFELQIPLVISSGIWNQAGRAKGPHDVPRHCDAEVLGNYLNNPSVSRGKKKPRTSIWVQRLSKCPKPLLDRVAMVSECSSNVAIRNIGLWILLEGVSDESHLTSEVGRINEIGMGQNGQQCNILGIRKGLNKSHVDWLGRDKGVKVAALVIG
jgi:hypothetical protein